jgi:CRISPR-associated protein (TIGR03986 family)
MNEKFRNPYNFITLGEPLTGMLAQKKPAGHDRYHHDRWSGRIGIEIETVTPLLIPDAARAEESANGHKIFDVRQDGSGLPLLPVTSLKGPLRSAYEVLTNSRFPFFRGHDPHQPRRMNTNDAGELIPARVNAAGTDFELLPGHPARLPVTGGSQRQALAGAWLNRYHWNARANRLDVSHGALSYPGGAEPRHGDELICEIELRLRRTRFAYWQVIQIQPAASATLSVTPTSALKRASWSVGDRIVVRGYVFISHHNTGNKHDERVFFSPLPKPSTLPVSDEVRKQWKLLILDYKDRHSDAVKKRTDSGLRADKSYGQNVGETAFSRHVLDRGYESLANRLCYVRLDNARTKVIAAFPVTLSRELGQVSPDELVPDELRPAAGLGELSPADRVFGWVSQNGKGAYKGQLRIHSIECAATGGDAIETFGQPLPLAILGAPKVSQARFYAGNADGSPLADGENTAAAGYFEKVNKKKWGLRGRKVYPHHAATLSAKAETAGYWDKEKAEQEAYSEPSDNDGHVIDLEVPGASYREYLRRRGGETSNADSQNRSIRAWVKPGTKFTAAIDVINLNFAELGVLLWLLDLPGAPQAYHRLGGGKPLGFGSVKISIKHVDLGTGAAKQARYRSFYAPPDYSSLQGQHVSLGDGNTARDFIAKAEEVWGNKFEELPNAKPFLQSARGYCDGIPTHYPRRDGHPNPAGENFKWFGENESGRRGRKAQQLALPAITEDKGLPLDPTV